MKKITFLFIISLAILIVAGVLQLPIKSAVNAQTTNYVKTAEWHVISSNIISNQGVKDVASSSITGRIVLKGTAIGGSMLKPTASDFTVVFASSTNSTYNKGNSVTGGNKVVTVSPSDATVGDGGSYTVTITDTVYSSDTEIGSSQTLFMAIAGIRSTVGNSVINEVSNLEYFRTSVGRLDKEANQGSIPPTGEGSELSMSTNIVLNPVSSNILIDKYDGAKQVLMQAVDFRSTSGDSVIKKIVVSTDVSQSKSQPSTLYLYNGSTLISSIANKPSGYLGGENAFNNLNIVVKKDANYTLLIKADFPSNSAGGIASTSIYRWGVEYETPSRKILTVRASDTFGKPQHLVSTAFTWSLLSTNYSLGYEIKDVASSSITGRIVLKGTAIGGSMLKPTASDFTVVFASSTNSTYNKGNSVTGGSKSVHVTPNVPSIKEGESYTVTIVDTVFSSDTEIGSSQTLFMAIAGIRSTVGNIVTDQTWGLEEFRTSYGLLTKYGYTAIPACYQFNTNLTRGSTGPDVVALQTWLMDNGYNILSIYIHLTSKGYFGIETESALKKYQAQTGLPANGFFGPETRAKLNSCSNDPITAKDEVIVSKNMMSIEYSKTEPLSEVYTSKIQLGVFDIESPTQDATLTEMSVYTQALSQNWNGNAPINMFENFEIYSKGQVYTSRTMSITSGGARFTDMSIPLSAGDPTMVIIFGIVKPNKNRFLENSSVQISLNKRLGDITIIDRKGRNIPVRTGVVEGHVAKFSGSYDSNALSTTCYQYTRDLTIGSEGEDVSTLTTWLLNNGYGTNDFAQEVSSGIHPKSYFSSRTATALAKYQNSVGIPSTGYFGPLTRAKLNMGCANSKPIITANPVQYPDPYPAPAAVTVFKILSPNGGVYDSGSQIRTQWTSYNGDFDYYQLIIGNLVARSEVALDEGVQISKYQNSYNSFALWYFVNQIVKNSGYSADAIKNSYYIKVNAIKSDKAEKRIVQTAKSVVFTISSPNQSPAPTLLPTPHYIMPTPTPYAAPTPTPYYVAPTPTPTPYYVAPTPTPYVAPSPSYSPSPNPPLSPSTSPKPVSLRIDDDVLNASIWDAIRDYFDRQF